MKNRKKLWIILVSIIIVSNIPPFTGIFRFFLDQKHYRYSNSDGTSTFYEFMSRDFEMAKRRQAHCLLKKPDLKDRKHYRLFSKNPLAFWRWRLYFFDERYKLPYKNWEEIEKTRKSAAGVSGCITEF